MSGWSWIVRPAGAGRKLIGINLGDELVGWMHLSTETAAALDAAISADATAAEERGYRQAIADLRDEAAQPAPVAGWQGKVLSVAIPLAKWVETGEEPRAEGT